MFSLKLGCCFDTLAQGLVKTHILIKVICVFVGIVPLFDVNAVVLFDSGAMHSFVVLSFAQTHKLNVVKDARGWNISIPTGVCRSALWVCRRCPITLEHLTLLADLIVLEMKDFDIIFGMD